MDNVGTVPAALTTYLAIQAFKPDIVISAGTPPAAAVAAAAFLLAIAALSSKPLDPLWACALPPPFCSSLCLGWWLSAGTAGGFRSRSAAIADVFVSTGMVNHDRRIPIPVWALLCMRHPLNTACT